MKEKLEELQDEINESIFKMHRMTSTATFPKDIISKPQKENEINIYRLIYLALESINILIEENKNIKNDLILLQESTYCCDGELK